MRHLTLWNQDQHPWRGLLDLQRNLDRVFDQTLADDFRWQESTLQPACDIDETESHYVVAVDLPGIAKKDIQLEIKDGEITVSGERKREKKEQGFSERYHGKFQRTITLPAHVDAEKVEAYYQDGVLTIAVPKAESAKSRQIKISDGKTGGFFGRLVGGKETDKKEDFPTNRTAMQ